MSLPRSILGFTAIAFLGFGVASAFWPESMATVAEIRLPTITAHVDFAATYGGFDLGFGTFLLLCLRRPIWLEAGLWAGALALGGFAIVRLITLLAWGMAASPPIYGALALEISGVLLNAWALKRLPRSHVSAA